MRLQEFIQKSETYQEILAEGRTLGLAEGRREGIIEVIIAVLRLRFGEFDSGNLTAQLQVLENASLDKLVAEAAVYVESFEAFQKLLETPRTQPANI